MTDDRQRRAEGAAWALTIIVAWSSAAFAVGAVAGWYVGVWPATPLTLAVAAVLVLAGPALALALTQAIRRGAAPPPAGTTAAPAPPRPAPAARAPAPGFGLSPRAARARELLDWRDAPPRS